jgi:hypothetical protein
MMRKIWVAAVLAGFFPTAAMAAPVTIVSHETEKFFYRDGKMEKFEGQFENTYLLDLEKETLVRTRVYDFQQKKIMPDETVYRIQKDLQSYPPNAIRFNVPPVIKAYGEPDDNTSEMVMIEDDFVHTAQANGSNLVISRGKRLK